MTTTKPLTVARAGVLQEVFEEWDDLVRTGAFHDELERLTRAWPQLKPLLSDDASGATSATTSSWSRDEADAILHALLVEYAGGTGSYIAGRLVLQCMLPAVARLADRHAHLHDSYADAAMQAVGAMWAAATNFPVERKRTKVAAHLYYRCLDDLCASKTTNAPTPVGSSVLAAAGLERADDGGDDVADPSHEVVRLLAWSLDHEVLRPDEAALLARLYLADDEGRAPSAKEVAAELGVSHVAVRARSSRAVRRLARAVITREYLAAA